MLYDLEPSQEIAGGPWFTDFELDSEFVEELVGSTSKLLMPKIVPGDQQAIFPLNHPYPNIDTLGNLISDSRICNTNLSSENVRQILDRLYYDGSIYFATGREEDGPVYSSNERLCMFGIDIGSSTFY